MGNIDEDLRAEAMTPADAKAALPLSVEAGWNQTVDDWRFMLGEGRGIGLRDDRGRWMASALALPLGPRLSWLSMVLVAKSERRRGFGTRLLRRCIDEVRGGGRVAGLDATELGRPVYLPLGFRELYPIARLRLETNDRSADSRPGGSTIRSLVPADLPALIRFDAARSAMRREAVLAFLLRQAPGLAFAAELEGELVGYVLARPGRIAFQIGPVLADDEEIAAALIGRALSELRGPVILDVPEAHRRLRAWLDVRGAIRERGYFRMILDDPVPGLANPGAVFALAGPELG